MHLYKNVRTGAVYLGRGWKLVFKRSFSGMRVRCVQIVSTSGPNLRQPVDHSPHMAIGDEYHVLSILIEADPNAALPRLVQVLGDGGPAWWPMEMFVTVSSGIPPNWTLELRPDGSLHFAPERWLRSGFWEEYFDNPRDGEAAETFRQEVEIIAQER